MEFVWSVWLSLGRDDAAQCFTHEIALRNSSQSRMPYDILSQRPSGSERGDISFITHREISFALSVSRSESAISTRTKPHKGSWPVPSRTRRYQLINTFLDRGAMRNIEQRSPRSRPRTLISVSSPSC